MAYAPYLYGGLDSGNNMAYAADPRDDNDYSGGMARYRSRRMPSWAAEEKAKIAEEAAKKRAEVTNFDPNEYTSSRLFDSTDDGANAAAVMAANNDAMSKAFYGGALAAAGQAGVQGLGVYGLGTIMGAPQKLVGDAAFNTSIASLPTSVPGIVGSTLAEGMGFRNESTVGQVASGFMSGLGSLLGGFPGALVSIGSKFAGPVVGDITGQRPYDAFRDIADTDMGYLDSSTAYNRMIDRVSPELGSTYGALDAAESAYNKSLSELNSMNPADNYGAWSDKYSEATANKHMVEALGYSLDPDKLGPSLMGLSLTPTELSSLNPAQRATLRAEMGYTNPTTGTWSGNINSINNPNPLSKALAVEGISPSSIDPDKFGDAVVGYNRALGMPLNGDIGAKLREINAAYAIDQAKTDLGLMSSVNPPTDPAPLGYTAPTVTVNPEAGDPAAKQNAGLNPDGLGDPNGLDGPGEPGNPDKSDGAAAAAAAAAAKAAVVASTSRGLGVTSGGDHGGGPAGTSGTNSNSGGNSTGGVSGNSGGAGNGGTGGAGRVICTELVRQGLMSKRLLKYEELYTLRNYPTYAIRGYHFWAVPFVKWMQRSKLATNIAKMYIWRAEEIAYKMGKRDKGNWKGKIIRAIFEPICYVLGPFVKYDKADKKWDRSDSERLIKEG